MEAGLQHPQIAELYQVGFLLLPGGVRGLHVCVCVWNPWNHYKQPIQSCTNEDTGCVLVISVETPTDVPAFF